MRTNKKKIISKSTLLLAVLVLISSLAVFNIFTNININFSYRDNTFEGIKLDFNNINTSMNQQFEYVNFRIAEISKWISRDLEEAAFSGNFNDEGRLSLLRGSTQYLINEMNSYLETGMILYIDVDENAMSFSDTIVLVKLYDAYRNSTSIIQRVGPIEVAESLGLDYNSLILDFYNVGNSEFYNYMKEEIEASGKTAPDSSMNYWHRLEEGSNPDLYSSLCSTPIFLNGKVSGVLTFSFADLMLSNLLAPKTSGSGLINLFFAFGDESGLSLGGSPNLHRMSATGFVNPEEVIRKEKVGSFNTYIQGDKKFYGFDSGIKMYPENTIYEHPDSYILLLTDAPPNYMRWIKSIVAGFLVSLTAILFFLHRKYDYLDKLFGKYDDWDEEDGVDLKDLLLEANRTSSSPSQRQDSSAFENFMNSIETLTPTERQVFDLYCKDFSPKEVSEELNISINTVKSHNRKIYDKLGAANKAELQALIRMMKDS